MAARATRRKPGARSVRDERGGILVIFVLFLPVLVAFAAFVLDIGHVFQLRRHLQSSADAAALAAAQELPDAANATAVANEYSASPGRRNVNPNLPEVATAVSFPTPAKVRVTQSARSRVFFAGLFGYDGWDVSATAVASKTSAASGTPLAVYVHELCGASTGNKGLIAAGDNMRIEGGIHVNGQFKVGNPGFEAVGKATVYRPSAGSPSGPSQGSCNGLAPLRVEDVNGGSGASKYCTGCSTGAVFDPVAGAYRDWVTPYHIAPPPETDPGKIMKSYTPCTINHPGDVKYENTTIPSGVHCVPKDKKFTIAGNTSGNITVIAGFVEVGGTGVLRPYNPAHPVLFYSTNCGEIEPSGRCKAPGTAIKMNPSGAYDWNGYIINRLGGIEINAAGVTSPFNGLLEAEWIHVNGLNFRMLGTFPDSTDGPMTGSVALEE
jgi:Flp pilus assembly protein TadG